MIRKIGIIFYYISFLFFPLSIYLIYYYFQKDKNILIIFLFLFLLLLIRMRFVEPNIIKIARIKVDSNIELRIALIADLHL
jgi:hypothetical protein